MKYLVNCNFFEINSESLSLDMFTLTQKSYKELCTYFFQPDFQPMKKKYDLSDSVMIEWLLSGQGKK